MRAGVLRLPSAARHVDMLRRMARPTVCRNCGAALDSGAALPIVCRFCDAVNEATPNEVTVEVPVPVQIVQNVVNVTTLDGGAMELRCPHCKKRLVTVKVGDVDLAGCGGCGGIWVDNASAKRLIASPQRVVLELAERASRNAKAQRPPRSATPTCPACPAILDRVRSHQIELDICQEHGTWFDTYELQGLMRALLGEGSTAPKPPRNDAPVQCVGCKTTMTVGRSNIGADGPTCDTCWRAEQERLYAVADAQHTTAAAGAGAGLLLLGALGAGLAIAAGGSSRS
jgi:Zn-finger nucleic acid-binding protein